MQHFTELGLRIASSRISSDGGWFHDVFCITECNGQKVTNPRKVESIKHMLDVYMLDEELVDNGDDTDDMNRVETTVFQLAGQDRSGLLSEVTELLTDNGCNVRSAAIWTYRGRVAFVLSVTEKGRPISDPHKLEALRNLVTGIMKQAPSTHAPIVDIQQRVRGEVHHDRRLHQLMLREERELWASGVRRFPSVDDAGSAAGAGAHGSGGDMITPSLFDEGASSSSSSPADSVSSIHKNNHHHHDGTPLPPSPQLPPSSTATALVGARGGIPQVPSSNGKNTSYSNHYNNYHPNSTSATTTSIHQPGSGNGTTVSPFRSPKFDRPQIEIEFVEDKNYWSISIRCRDRTKLLFDTVCTLADMNYDIWHATIDAVSDGTAAQEYYVRPRTGGGWSESQAELLKAMLSSSIQRRFPKGLKIHVHSLDRFGCLAALTKVLSDAQLSITRAKVRTFATSNSSGHTFYVMEAGGGPPDKKVVQDACQQIGGKLVDSNAALSGAASLGGSHKFSFAFLQRQWANSWGGSPGESVFGSV